MGHTGLQAIITRGLQSRKTQFGPGRFDQNPGEQRSYLVSGQQRIGADISLTIDAELSEYAYELLDGRDGAILLMNYKTG